MIILSASEIGKSYGTDVILENISFHINEGDKVGIIGVNGAGKSTLLNILTGELSQDTGSFFIAKDTTVGYLRQRDSFDDDKTVIEEVDDIFFGLASMEKEINELSELIARSDESEHDALWKKLNALQHEFESRGGYTYKSEINGVLSSMAFGEEYYDRPTGSLSGGERTRLALACLLLKKPDLLFLDEPTNHLDIGTLKWLEQYLKSYKGTLVLVSHDRYFLDQVVNNIFELSNHKMACYRGNYSEYAEKRRALREAAFKAYDKQQAEIKRQEDLIRRYKERGTEKLAKRAASREKRLSHIERVDKPTGENKKIRINFHQDLQSGNDVLIGEGISKSFGTRELFKNASFDIKRGERICIVGPNGIGKTTLLKIMIGHAEASSGYIKQGFNTEFGYYDQGQQLLDDSLTVMDEIHNEYRRYTDGEIRGILGRFLFTGDMVFRSVGSLSGGEKARLALLKLMMSGANVLVLDEPTNHLDIESKEAFEDALFDYPGTLITVTHDRYFLNKIPDRIFELEHDGITEYLGKYDYYVEKKESIKSGVSYLREMREENAPSSKLSAAEERERKKRLEAEERRQRREKERLEKLIEDIEEEIGALEKELCDPDNFANYELLASLSERIAALKSELEDTYEAWSLMVD